jgi:IS1 family transposase
MKRKKRPPLESLACINERCQHHGQRGQGNLRVRKIYGHDDIRYLRCGLCQEEFSDRKGTALWNSKVPEAKFIAVAEQLAEGTSHKGTARVTRTSPCTVKRVAKCVATHGRAFHDEQVRHIPSTAIQADERWGFAGDKSHQVWEAEAIDPASRLVIERVSGKRDEHLIECLLKGTHQRLSYPQGVVLFTDGEPSYPKLFKRIFGYAYRPCRKSLRGRPPRLRYRIGRRQAHVRIIKHRLKKRLESVEVYLAHGSNKRVRRELERLGYKVPNTSAIERRNGTARAMDAFSVRKSLAFARTPESREYNGSWAMTVYNWAREHRSLKQLLSQPVGNRKYEKRSPAMAAGLTECIWSIEDVLRHQPFPSSGVG